MPHTSPATYAIWSILSCTLFVFLISHLWAFDRFRSLRWGKGSGNGAFKRVMTYTYMLSVPLICTYACGFAYIKYTEGWIDVPAYGGIIPKPHELWTQRHRDMIFPLQMLFSVAWSLEIVTHLEELCFWMFLLRSTASAGEAHWFRSIHFRLWILGSFLAIVGIPLVTIFKRHDPDMAEAWTFLVASSGSFLLTLLFLPVLFGFPEFLRKLKAEGTQRRVVLRLCHFHDINIVRIAFRFLFVLPLFILGLDGVLPEPVINHSMFWTDLLAFLAAMGCCSSSVMTLLIFFPRDLEAEAGYGRSTRSSSFGGGGNTVPAYPANNNPHEKAPPRPHRPDSAGEYEGSVPDGDISQMGSPYLDGYATQRYSGFSAGSTGTPTSAHPLRYAQQHGLRREIVQEHGTDFEVYGPPPPDGSTLALTRMDEYDGKTAPPGLSPPRVTVAPPPSSNRAAARALYPPRGRFGGEGEQQRDQQQHQQNLNVHPMLRHYRSPIDLIDSYYSTPRPAARPPPSGNYV